MVLLFVLMYFFTGYVMIHPKLFGRSEPRTSVRTVMLPATRSTSDESLSAHLQQTLDLHGQRQPAQHRPDGTTMFRYGRPGKTTEAVLDRAGKEVTITEKDLGFNGAANGLHRLRGYRGGTFYVVWATFYDLASCAMIVFAISGVILWFQSTVRRTAGLSCLAGSFGFVALMVAYLILHK
jgi:hypothetical protein